MPEFFSGWPLWEKMTFVLALAIVASVILGLGKNIYSRIKLRAYTTVANAARETTPSMIESQRAYDDEIPFGVRALESGIEVQGVWISRSNTPVTDSPRSPESSALPSASSSLLNEPGTSLPPPMSETGYALQMPQPVSPSGIPSWSRRQSGDRAHSTERPGTSHGYSLSQHSQTSSRSRRTSIPTSSHLRYSITMESMEDSSGLIEQTERRVSTFSEDSTPRPKPTSPTASHEFSNSSKGTPTQLTDAEERFVREVHTRESYGKGKDRFVDMRTDLRLLQSHRLSHAAETGTLSPRVRRPTGMSADWSNSRASPPNAPWQPQAPLNHIEQRPAPQPPLPSPVVPSDEPPEQKALIDVHYTSLAPMHMHEVAKAEEMGRILPLNAPYPPFSSQESLEIPEPAHSIQHSTGQPIKYDRHSHVLRKVNSTFEILQPGTLNAQTIEPKTLIDESVKDKRRRSGRRLQKDRPSMEHKRSSRSSFIDIIYGHERHPPERRVASPAG